MNQQQQICGINNCSFKTTNKAVMDIHIKGLHSTNTNFSNKWGKTFKFKESTFKVNNTFPIQQKNEKQFKCNICEFTTQSEATLNFHNNTHKSAFSCNKCHFTTNWKGVLDDHTTKNHTHTNKMKLSFILNK